MAPEFGRWKQEGLMFKVVLRSAEDTGCPTFKNKREGAGVTSQ